MRSCNLTAESFGSIQTDGGRLQLFNWHWKRGVDCLLGSGSYIIIMYVEGIADGWNIKGC